MQTIALDKTVFNLVHSTSCSGSVWDKANLFISDKSFFIWIGFLIIYILLTRFKGLFASVVAASSFVVSWIVTDEFIKPLFDRSRPFIELGSCVYGHKPETSSFPSGHALTAFAIATVICLYNRNNKILFWLAILFASFVAYSRIYLGVHFPTDILGGAALGSLFGLLWFKFAEFLRAKWIQIATKTISSKKSQKIKSEIL